jgi:K+-transporting ATPase ATPase B chain
LPHDKQADWLFETVTSEALDVGDVVLVEAGELIPADGEVIDRVAEVDESVVTGESAPVVRESCGNRSAVIGGTCVLSDWLKIKITAKVGMGFNDQVVCLIVATRSRASRHELVLTLPLIGMATLIAVAAAAFRLLPEASTDLGSLTLLIALLTALLPTATAGLLSAAGMVGMDRLLAANIVAKSGVAVEAAGLVDTLLLDKTGTITLGGRTAEEFLPSSGTPEREVVEAAFLASQSDETPEGRSIARFGEDKYGMVSRTGRILAFLPFSAETRMSGVVMMDGTEAHKGAPDAILQHLGAAETPELMRLVDRIARSGGTPLAVSRGRQILGVAHLKDAIRPGMREQCAMLRRMGMRTIMVTGDNTKTAATVAAAAGVDDFVAEATPQAKLQLIRDEQAGGKRVGMCGDGTNVAPALAQADLGIALCQGSAAAREAGNMIDFTGDPMTLIEVIRTGRQVVSARHALTGFAMASDLAKYLAIVPVVFAAGHPPLAALEFYRPVTFESALLAGNMFNALIVLTMLPLALHVTRRRASGGTVLRRGREILVYALIGLVMTPVAIGLLQRTVMALGVV